MAIKEVNLTVIQIIEDLNNGLTWLKKDDLGYGSIEAKYNGNPTEIAKVRRHPKLKDAETTITIFNIIDDTTSHSDQVIDIMNNESSPSIEEAADLFENL